MSVYLTTGTKKPKVGKPYKFWIIRETYYDREISGTKHRYLGYVGKEPVITESKAREICEKRGLTLDQLQNVNKLTIVPDPEPEKTQQEEALIS